LSTFFMNQPPPDEIRRRVEGYPVWAEVDLDAIGRNLDTVRRLTGAEVVPCVKSNAYGHGLAAVVAYLKTRGIRRFLVAKLWEARQIRRTGLECGVVNMDPLFTEDQFREAVELGLTQVVYHRESAAALSQAAVNAGMVAPVWVKVDTGLGRVGVVHTEAAGLIEHISGLRGVRVDGVFSTLLEDDGDEQQIARFLQLREELESRGVHVDTWSLASSHGVFFRPGAHLDAVRPGVMLFGFYPVPEARGTGVVLSQALSLKGRLEHVKTVEAGTPLTYGGAYVAPHRVKVGTMHMGYSDGYLRQLSRRGLVRVGDRVCPVIGGVSINHLLVDLTDVDAGIGDVVEAVSREGPNSAQALCDLAGVEPYQLAVWMSPLIPRVYTIGGEPVALSEPQLTERSA
jgi:alanine racemase